MLVLSAHVVDSCLRVGLSTTIIKIAGQKMLGSYLYVCLLFFIVYATLNTSFGSAGFLFWVLYGIVFWYFNEARKAQEKA